MKTQIGTKFLFGVALLLLLTGGGLIAKHWQRDRLRESLIQAVLVRDSGEAARLLAAGADLNARDVLPMHRTTWEAFLDRLPFLHRQPERTRKDPVMPTALMLAATGARLDRRCSEYPMEGLTTLMPLDPTGPCAVQDQSAMARLLLDHGADVNASAEEGWTPLMLACKAGNLQIATLLLDRGAKLNTPDSKNVSAISLAVGSANPALVTLLLDRGADTGPSGTPLSNLLGTAISEVGVPDPNAPIQPERRAMILLLLAHGADVNAKTYSGTTALMMAAKGTESAASILLLLAAGADPAARDWKGRTALSMAHYPTVSAALTQPL